jgi:hypothetical protein
VYLFFTQGYGGGKHWGWQRGIRFAHGSLSGLGGGEMIRDLLCAC